MMRMIVISLAILVTVDGYGRNRDKIPNGYRVPNPCIPGDFWCGVGHRHHEGDGPRNEFGIDFKRLHGNWIALCPLDSDGDGVTNGAELADPNCIWRMGMPSPAGVITHPGVCEPAAQGPCVGRYDACIE